MQAQQQAKKAVKISYQGETKRIQHTSVYQELIDHTRTAFNQLSNQQFKFFYSDEDNEIISISSQNDYTEALEIEDFSSLRLTIAKTAGEARQQLLTQLEDQRPLAESLNSSQPPVFDRQSTIDSNNLMDESAFDAVSHADLAHSINGPIVNQEEAGCSTARVESHGNIMIDTCEASQMDVQVMDVDIIVRKEVQEYCYNSFKQMFTDYLGNKKVEQDKIVHENVLCDECGANPIVGIRYMCSVCSNTDFCETCEKNGVHAQHPLLKIRKPSHAPARFICTYNRETFVPAENKMSHSAQNQKDELNDFFSSVAQQPPKSVRYSARFVKESIPDKYEVPCGDSFSKSWKMRNDGETSWPAGTQLLQTSGDDMSSKVVTLEQEVVAGETCEISVQFKAPALEGRYTSFFRLQTGKIKFGHKVSCDILCVEPMEPVDKEVADDASQQPSSLLMQSTISIDAQSPKELYFESVEKVKDDNMKIALTSLYDFGYTNFSVNNMLMNKHKDVNLVANQLMSGCLTESQFGNIIQGQNGGVEE